MNPITWKIPCKLTPGAKPLRHNHPSDVGFDLAALRQVIVPPHREAFVSTGVYVCIPTTLCGFIWPRSSTRKKGLNVFRGLIDPHYCGELGVLVYNRSDKNVTIEEGEYFAQLVILPRVFVDFDYVDELPETSRGEGGWGSTGRF